MIKVIIFDVGGVYLDGSFVNFVNKVNKVLNINKNFHTNQEVIVDIRLAKGEIPIKEFFKKYFKKKINRKQMRKIIKIWTNTWKLSTEMKKLVKKLKKNYRLAILSNSDSLNSQNYEKKGWYKYFDVLILSHKLGVRKPQKKIYDIAIKKLNVKPKECLFIDNQEECLKPARKIGMKTVLFKSKLQLKKELRKLRIKF